MTRLCKLDRYAGHTDDHEVVKANKVKLALEARADDVEGALESFRVSEKSERHVILLIKSVVRVKRCAVLVTIINSDLPIAAASV